MTTSRLYASKKLMGALLLMMGFVLPANAQFLRTSYFMEGTHYRQQLNPALIPTQGYFNIPVLDRSMLLSGPLHWVIRILSTLLTIATISTLIPIS